MVDHAAIGDGIYMQCPASKGIEPPLGALFGITVADNGKLDSLLFAKLLLEGEQGIRREHSHTIKESVYKQWWCKSRVFRLHRLNTPVRVRVCRMIVATGLHAVAQAGNMHWPSHVPMLAQHSSRNYIHSFSKKCHEYHSMSKHKYKSAWFQYTLSQCSSLSP